jgi:hypothetical protein
MSNRRIVVGFSGGVTSAWCAGWALRNFPREEVVLLWHDTKEEHPDTYRFLKQMADKLGMPITERSDGRSVTELFYDEGFLGNNQNAMCSRILKVEQGRKFSAELRAAGVTEIIKVFGYSAKEIERVQRAVGMGISDGFTPRFPIMEQEVTKQQCADWCTAQGVCPSEMYLWSEHANCQGCVKGGRAYWLKVAQHAPAVFEQRAQLEDEFGHSIIRGEKRKGEERAPFLRELVKIGLKRAVNPREKIELGPCECGD